MIKVNFDSEKDTYKTAAGLWQWDYGQVLQLAGLSLPAAVEIHFSLQQSGGDAITRIGVTEDNTTTVGIPDEMLENNGKTTDYTIYAFVYTADEESGETVYRISMPVKSRPRPKRVSETTMEALMAAINQIADGKADSLEYKNNVLRLLAGEKELDRITITGGSGSGEDAREIELQKGETAIQWHYVGDPEWKDLISLEEITGPAGPAGADGQPGQDGAPGADGKDGRDGEDGITPHIGDNGNWYLGETDTGKPSRGETGPAGEPGRDGVNGADGAPGQDGADGKSAYQYAQDGGYTGTEEEFAALIGKQIQQNKEDISKLSEEIEDIKLLGGDSVLAEIVPTNNLFDPANLVTSFVDKDGNTVNGNFTNYIKLGLNKRYVTNLNNTQFHFFDENKVHLSTSTYISNPQIITGNGGYLLVKLGSDYSNAIFIEGTDIGAYKEQHVKIKSNLLDNKWYGKRWLCIGDSISTDESSLAKNGYAKLISRELGMILTNISVSGKTMKDGYEWLDSINDEYDLITVMLGTNNQGYNCALGSLNDEYYTNGEYSSNNSFYAQTQLMAEKLKTKFPKSVVMFLTPIKRTAVGDTTNNNDAGYQINALGFTTEKYRDVIIDVCNYYSLPYEDLYNCIDPRTEENRTLYFMSEDDGTHPNDLGHALYLAPTIKNAIVRQAPYYFSDWSAEEPTEPDEPTETTYAITRNLIGCTSSSDVSEITEGSTHSETLTASDGYTLEGATVSVTMGDSDISSLYSNGTLNIESVNGNIVIAVSAVIESTGEDNTPVLLHSYSGTPVEFVENGTTYTMLEDLTNNLDLKANSWYKAQGVNLITGSETTYLVDRVQNKENWIIERNNSFSIKIKNFKRDSNYFSQLWGFHTGLIQSMNISVTVDGTVYDSYGRINFEITAPEGSTSVFGDGELRISYYEEGATKLTPFYSSLKFNNGETHDVMVIYDKTKKNLKVYQDTELCIDETLTRDLSIDGICFGNLKYSSIERIEIYKGVVDVA